MTSLDASGSPNSLSMYGGTFKIDPAQAVSMSLPDWHDPAQMGGIKAHLLQGDTHNFSGVRQIVDPQVSSERRRPQPGYWHVDVATSPRSYRGRPIHPATLLPSSGFLR